MPDVSVLLTIARCALVVYATLATILTTACLTLQALAAFDRRRLQRRATRSSPRVRRGRSLFVHLDPRAGQPINDL